MWRVHVEPLDNGMMLYAHPGAANVSGIGFKAGSIYDPPGLVGMAHYVEHLVSRISRQYPNVHDNDLLFRKYMMGPGKNCNIRTDRWSVFYGNDTLLRRKHMEEIFAVMASFVHPKSRIIDLEGAQIESAAVHEEYFNYGIDVMENLLDDLMHQTMYEGTNNPARHRIDCEVDDLKRITLKNADQFLRRYYVPKNASVIILGPKVEDAKALALRHFRDWDDKRTPILGYDHSEDLPKLSGVRSHETERPGIHQYHCGIGFPTETYKTNDAEAIDVLGEIFEARLELAIRDGNRDFNGGSYRTPVLTERSFVHGMFWASFATISHEFETRAEEIVLREYEQLKNDLVSQKELESAIGSLYNEYLDAFWNTPSDLSERIIDAAVNGDGDLTQMHAFRSKVLRVSRKKVREIANKYFGKNYARVLIKPAP